MFLFRLSLLHWVLLFQAPSGLCLAVILRAYVCKTAFADCCIGWWLIPYLFFVHFLFFQPAGCTSNTPGNLLLCPLAAKRLPSPNIRAIFLLIETHSAATAFSQGGKWQVETSGRPSPPRLHPFGKSACDVDKFRWGSWSNFSSDATFLKGM